MMYHNDEVNHAHNRNPHRDNGSKMKELKMCEINIPSMGAGERGPTSTANVKLD